ncbi:MAG: YcgL domain-containing protein [Gammaproteobacteria bacterium]|nr:YcgL domain-containing protein [Gammaproteobacteria bacterium]
MQCFVYRSLKKNGLYIYLSQQDDFEKIPDAVKNKIGELEFALEFELHEDRKLAKEDASTVIENIKNNGFHIQMPKDIEGLLAEISAGLK